MQLLQHSKAREPKHGMQTWNVSPSKLTHKPVEGYREPKHGMQQRPAADIRSRLNDTHGFRYFHLPHATAIGFENNDIKGWIERVMKDKIQSSIPLTVISSNISAATYLATVSLTLSSLIGTWIESNTTVFQSTLIYGDTRSSTMTLKYVSLLDGATFVVDVAVTTLSQTVEHWLDEENDTDKAIPLPNVRSTILAMVIEYCKKHAGPEPEDCVAKDAIRSLR